MIEVSWYGGASSLRHAAAGLGDNDKCSFELAPNVLPFHNITSRTTTDLLLRDSMALVDSRNGVHTIGTDDAVLPCVHSAFDHGYEKCSTTRRQHKRRLTQKCCWGAAEQSNSR